MSDVKRYYVSMRGGVPVLVEASKAYLEETGAPVLVKGSDADKLEAEAKALREELARINALANCGSVQNWLKLSDEDKAKWFALYCRHDDENVGMRRELEELRARVVEFPDFDNDMIIETFKRNGFRIELGASYSVKGQIAQLLNALEELARLNGNAVSEGLLRRTLEFIKATNYQGSIPLGLIAELSELLGEGKEHE